LRPVILEVADEIGMAFQRSLDSEQFTQLLCLADEQGIAFDALAREWIVERLRDAGTLSQG